MILSKEALSQPLELETLRAGLCLAFLCDRINTLLDFRALGSRHLASLLQPKLFAVLA